MKRILTILIMVVSITLVWQLPCFALQPIDQDLIDSQLESLELHEIQELIKDLDNSLSDYIPTLDFKEMINQMISGELSLSPAQVLNGFLKYLFKETVANTKIIIQLIVLSVICAILRNLENSFNNEAISQLAYTVCYLVLVMIVIQSFALAIKIGSDAIAMMVSLMQTLMPILLVLLASIGGFSSASVLQPIIMVSVGLISTLVKTVILPIIFFSAVLTIVNNISDKFQISKLTSLLKQVSGWLIGLIFTVFLGILSIQGIASSTIDGVTIRTAKFAVDNFVPVVGGFLSDSVDAIIGCSLVIKNSIGAAGLIFLFIICLLPLAKLLALSLVYKLSSAVIEPLGEGNLAKCLSDISGCLLLVFAAVSAVAIMFFIAMTIVISAGSTTVMLR
jgi:stage III sporulation protein AE